MNQEHLQDQPPFKSRVAALRWQINRESEAMWTGFHAFAEGESRHAFITTRASRLEAARIELASLLGEQEATSCVVKAYITAENASSAPAN